MYAILIPVGTEIMLGMKKHSLDMFLIACRVLSASSLCPVSWFEVLMVLQKAVLFP